MTNPILLGMACEYTRKLEPCSDLSGFDQTSAMKAALLWLADNVPFEMIRAAIEDRAEDDEQTYAALGDLIDFSGEAKTHTVVKSAIAAALRAAAEGEK